MSSIVSPAVLSATDTAGASRRPPRWLREPLLHFLLLGACLFALDHFLVARAEDPRTIVVTAEVDNEMRELFKARRGHEPSPEETAALRRAWLDNEVLYREGLALQMDRGDSAIRERVIFKALSVVDANVKASPPDEKTLRGWFEANRARYDEPQRYDFEEGVLFDDSSEGAAREFAVALNRGAPGNVRAGLRVYKARPHDNLVQGYGAEFAKALDALPAGQWQAMNTTSGWRVIRLNAVTAPKPAAFDELRGVIFHDWIDEHMSQQRTDQVRALARKYKVVIEGERR